MPRRRLERNLLVISDLHLGEDLRPSAESAAHVSYLRRLAVLERELENFLAHYTRNRVDDRPWRLVVNGDMVDFMAVMILPSTKPHGGAQDEQDVQDEEDRQFGLAYAERQTVEKLDKVVERHAGVFQRLAEFVAAGNELVIIVGNHDVEFHYPAVQARFLERLRGLAPTLSPEAIRFCPWFYYEEELVYVEHGHQYDEYCSFDYQLHPVEKGGHVAMSISHAGTRYFANKVPSIDIHVGEVWGLVDWLRWGWGMGAHRLAQLFYIYGCMVWKMIEVWSRLTDRKRDVLRRERHRARLASLAAEYRIAVDKVEALDRLRSMPVQRRLNKILRAFFLDRFALGFVVIVGVVISLSVASGWGRLYWSLSLLALAALANFALSRSRMIPSAEALRRAPELIGRILRAPFVVFGHSHLAEAIKLSSGGVYFNTGSWADENLKNAFTHLIISGKDEPRAELRQWRDGQSAPYPAILETSA